MAFRDLDEFLVVEPLVLPIRGKDYSFPGEISARTWLLLQTVAEKAQQARSAEDGGSLDDVAIPDDVEQGLKAELLGDAEQEMIDDGLTSAHLKAVMMTLIAFHLQGREAAEAVWEAQGEAPAPNREERRHKATSPSTRSRGSRAGSTARKQTTAAPGAPSSASGS